MPNAVTLVGLDFGTTTSSAVVASADLTLGAVGGRVELTNFRERFRSEMVFTPLDDHNYLDLRALETQLNTWLAAAGVDPQNIFGGGALLTGLTAETENARGLVTLVRRKLCNVLAATADDPCLESWLAFMGSCSELSRTHPDTTILNLDIGGGTTNPAIGHNGRVLATGCLYVGARHFQFEPGGYRLVRISPYGETLLDSLSIRKQVGDELAAAERGAILDAYINMLEALIGGRPIDGALRDSHEQVPLPIVQRSADLAVTFSGGVGELVYRCLSGEPWPATTAFGDFGIDLARRLLDLMTTQPHRYRLRPTSSGRAVSFGLLRHATEVSGSTLFLPRCEVLPLADLPIVGEVRASSSDEALRAALDLAKRTPNGAALQVVVEHRDAANVRLLGTRIAAALRDVNFPATRPLVLLLRENLGKTLGQYVTEWGALPVNLVVVDELAPRDAQYVQLGSPHHQVVPVSFYGLRPSETAS